jgi:hypothetical protein
MTKRIEPTKKAICLVCGRRMTLIRIVEDAAGDDSSVYECSVYECRLCRNSIVEPFKTMILMDHGPMTPTARCTKRPGRSRAGPRSKIYRRRGSCAVLKREHVAMIEMLRQRRGSQRWRPSIDRAPARVDPAARCLKPARSTERQGLRSVRLNTQTTTLASRAVFQ